MKAARLLLLVPLCLIACRTVAPAPQPPTYRAEALGGVRRMLVVPFVAENEFPDQAEMVTARFTQALRKGRFSVVPLHDSAVAEDLAEGVRLSGTMRADDLIRLEKDYGVDAVVLGTVTRYDPYAPQVLGLDVKVLSTRTAAVLWASSRVYDASTDRVAHDALRWYDRFVEETGAEFGPEVVLLSPRAYARYVCARMAASITSETTVADRR